MTDRLTEQLVINEGGWHPRYARILLIHQVADEAVVLVDGNGDGAEVEAERWFMTDRRWVDGSSGGIGPFDHRPLWAWGGIGDDSYAIGCAEPGKTVTVAWTNQVQLATADHLGIWVCAFHEWHPPHRTLDTRFVENGFRFLASEEAAQLQSNRPHIVASD